jgi:hypothetical protein
MMPFAISSTSSDTGCSIDGQCRTICRSSFHENSRVAFPYSCLSERASKAAIGLLLSVVSL